MMNLSKLQDIPPRRARLLTPPCLPGGGNLHVYTSEKERRLDLFRPVETEWDMPWKNYLCAAQIDIKKQHTIWL